MAQGAWDTGTWDAALWDSLPVTGNSSTGSPGNVGVAATIPITGAGATTAVGTVGATVTIALSGVQATGQVGSEGEAATVPVTGIAATGAAGTVGLVITISLSGNDATGSVGTVTPSAPPPIVIIDDTHDGRRFKEQLERDRKLRAKKKQAILDAFERIVEGRPEIAEEIAAPYVVTRPKAKSAPTINYDALFSDLDRVQRIWDTHLEMDDEDVLTLL
jgi:hypothetical protein